MLLDRTCVLSDDLGTDFHEPVRSPQVRLVIRGGLVRVPDRLLMAPISGDMVVVGWEPRVGRFEHLPLGDRGIAQRWEGHIVITSRRIEVAKGCIWQECSHCRELIEVHRAGLRNMGCGLVRNQPRHGECRH